MTPPRLVVLVLGGAGLAVACLDSSSEVELPVENGPGVMRITGDGAGLVVERARPDSIVGLLNVDGAPVSTVFRRFDSPETFPLRFSTYLPDGMAGGASGRDTVRFNFSGGREDLALEVIALPAGTSAEEARAHASASAGADGREEDPRPGLAASFYAPGERGFVRVDLLEAPGLWILLRSWQAEGPGDGVERRLRHVRATWIWEDSGKPLLRSDG